MGTFWKTAAAILITVIFCLTLEKREKDISVILTAAVISMTAVIALSYFRPVLDFLRELEVIGGFGRDILEILLKAVGIAVVTELAVLICSDGGYGSLGKGLQLLSSVVILYLSVPVFRELIHMIQNILGAL